MEAAVTLALWEGFVGCTVGVRGTDVGPTQMASAGTSNASSSLFCRGSIVPQIVLAVAFFIESL